MSGSASKSSQQVSKAVDEPICVEVHQQALMQIDQPHIGQHLGLVNRQQPLDALDLDEQNVFYDEIDTIATAIISTVRSAA